MYKFCRNGMNIIMEKYRNLRKYMKEDIGEMYKFYRNKFFVEIGKKLCNMT